MKGVLRPHLLDELLAAHTWHDQVTEHEIRLQEKSFCETVLTILCHYHMVLRRKNINEEMGHIWMVFYYQHDGRWFCQRCRLAGLQQALLLLRFAGQFSQEWSNLLLRDRKRGHRGLRRDGCHCSKGERDSEERTALRRVAYGD